MGKKDKIVGAKLSDAQKKQLKDDILKEFPALSIIEDDIDFLIEEYSERNKDIAKELMKKAENNPPKTEKEEVKWEMTTLKPNTPEYEAMMVKLQDVHKRERERQNEIYEKARKELLEKGVEITEPLDGLNVETVTIG